jgi:hypothetical protein
MVGGAGDALDAGEQAAQRLDHHVLLADEVATAMPSRSWASPTTTTNMVSGGVFIPSRNRWASRTSGSVEPRTSTTSRVS